MLGVLAAFAQPRRAEHLGLTLALVIAAGFYSWASYFRADPLDEGYFVYTSSRVLAGELPYRDFSTPYTPAFFYLNALLFKLFGLDLVTLRLSLVVVRVALVLLLYRLGRRLMPPTFAALAPLMVLAQDPLPTAWEVHPSWWATLAFVFAVWCASRHRESGRWSWWLSAALAAAVSYAFKQNIGLFALASLTALALTEARALPPASPGSWPTSLVLALPNALVKFALRFGGPLCLLALTLGVTWVMRHHLEPLLVLLFALPFGALGAERLTHASRDTDPAAESSALAMMVARLVLLGSVFLVVTVPWVVVLTLALGPDEGAQRRVVGAVDTAGYYFPLLPLREELRLVLPPVAVAPLVVWVLFGSGPAWFKLGAAVAGGLVCAWSTASFLAAASEVHPRPARAAMLMSVHATTNLLLYLPALAFWGGFSSLFGARLAGGQAFQLRWLLLAGSLLMLNQYPRIDEPHLLFSGALIWMPGAFALWLLYRRASSGWTSSRIGFVGRAALFLALLGLPLLAMWPPLELRREELIVREAAGSLALTTPVYVPLEVPGASVLEREEFARKYRLISEYIRATTAPEERIFVFPAAPLLYYLADRANATRFNHLLPGLLTGADEQETIRRLARVPAVYVIWDTFGADYWQAAEAYRELTDFIWDSYEPIESIGGFEILRRKQPS
jgi:hypothetical protein